MNIAGTEINLKHCALEIYLSGCKGHCQGCHNRELWDYSVGVPYQTEWVAISRKIPELSASGLVKFVWVLGGEPLDQNLSDLGSLLASLRKTGLKILLWTHYQSVPAGIAGLCDYLKLGPYRENAGKWIEPVLGLELANPEQHVVEAWFMTA